MNRCMYERGDYQDATYFGDQARNIGEDLEDDDASVGRFELPNLLSEVYYTLGAIAQITHKKRDSLELHTKMLILRKSIRHESSNGDALLAHAYNEIGNDFMAEEEEYNIAVGFYQTSIRIFRSLPQEKFNKTMLSLPMVNLGLAYWLQHKYQEAYEIVQEALHQHSEEMGVDDGLTMK
jgi:tetratricopeptide (TPR) repeat protein